MTYDKTQIQLSNTLIELILENPSLIESFGSEKENILKVLRETNLATHEELIKSDEVKLLDKITVVAMYSMLLYLEDKQISSNIIIEHFITEISSSPQLFDDLEDIEHLKFAALYLVVLILSDMKNYNYLSNLDKNLKIAQEYLGKAQINEVERENFNMSNGLKILTYSSIIFLVDILKKYIITGAVDVRYTEDIYTAINMHADDAFRLLGNEEIGLKLVGHFIKHSFTRLAERIKL